jgi:hypothetical protein
MLSKDQTTPARSHGVAGQVFDQLLCGRDHLQLPECLPGDGKWTGEAIDLNIR